MMKNNDAARINETKLLRVRCDHHAPATVESKYLASMFCHLNAPKVLQKENQTAVNNNEIPNDLKQQ